MEGFVDYYNIIGISKNASNEEIKKAYRKKAKEYIQIQVEVARSFYS